MSQFFTDFLAEDFPELTEVFGESVVVHQPDEIAKTVTVLIDQNQHQSVQLFEDGETPTGELQLVVKRSDISTPIVDEDWIEYDGLEYVMRREVFRDAAFYGLLFVVRGRSTGYADGGNLFDHG